MRRALTLRPTLSPRNTAWSSSTSITGVSLLYPCPEVVESALRFDFDFIAFDWQHGPWSEPTLIKIASGFEAAAHARTQPTFTGNITTANTAGTTLKPPKLPKKDDGRRQHRM